MLKARRWYGFFFLFFPSFYHLPSFPPLSSHSFVAPLHRLNVWQLTVSVSALFKWRLASTACILAFILGSQVQQRACMEAQGGKGSLPQWFIWTFPLFEMASQRPCMINVTTLTYTVLHRVPAEYLKTRNFSECPWAGLGMLWFDWQSACYSTFAIVHVMSRTQVKTPTN